MNNLHRQILRLSWPAIATNITTPLLSLVDVAIVGHISGGAFIAAVALGGTVLNIMYWLFGFLRMGTSGMTAQAFGASDGAECRLVFRRGVAIAVCATALIWMLTPLCGHRIIALVGGGDSVVTDAWLYFRLAILGAPGTLITGVVSGWLLGVQHPRAIMWIALTTNLLNIALSSTLVFVFGLGIEGVALGTAVSQIVSGCIGLVVVSKVRKGLQLASMVHGPEKRQLTWTRIFRINSDIFFRTLCLSTVTLWFTHAGAASGQDILAANALLMQLFMVFSYFMDGFAFAGEALAGQYYGADNIPRLRAAIRALFKWGIATSLLFTVVYFFMGDLFLNLLTDDLRVLNVAGDFTAWAVVIPFAGFTAFTWDGIMIGMTKTGYLLVSMVVSMIVFFGLYYGGLYLCTHAHLEVNNNHVLWGAFIAYLAVRGLVSTLLYRQFVKRQSVHKATPAA